MVNEIVDEMTLGRDALIWRDVPSLEVGFPVEIGSIVAPFLY